MARWVASTGVAWFNMAEAVKLSDGWGPPQQIRYAILNTFNALGMPDTIARA